MTKQLKTVPFTHHHLFGSVNGRVAWLRIFLTNSLGCLDEQRKLTKSTKVDQKYVKNIYMIFCIYRGKMRRKRSRILSLFVFLDEKRKIRKKWMIGIMFLLELSNDFVDCNQLLFLFCEEMIHSWFWMECINS